MSFAADDLAGEERDARVGLAQTRWLAGWEIASICISVLIAQWAIYPFVGDNRFLLISLGLAFAYIILSHRAWGESLRDLGWRRDNFRAAARLLALPMLLLTAALIVTGWFFGSLRAPRAPEWFIIIWLPLWGLMQQAILQSFVNRRAQAAFGRGWPSILVTAAVFGLLHMPNPWLTLATFIAGLVWAAIYQRAPNLFALALSHALMTAALVTTAPPFLLGGLRVGIRYLHWSPFWPVS